MKYSFIIFTYSLLLINSTLPNWNIDSIGIDLFSSSSSTSSYEYILYSKNGYTLKKQLTKNGDKITNKNYLTFSEYDYTVTQEVEFENIESTYYQQLGVDRLVCPKGKFHPYNLVSNEYIIPPNFVEEGDWDLSCYKHDTGYFLIFYTNNGDYSLYFKKGSNAITRTMAVSFDFFGYKLPEWENKDHNYKYKLPSLREDGGYLTVSGYVLVMNEGESAVNGFQEYGSTTITKMKEHTQASIDDNYYFYYFTYNNVSDFTSGYSNTYLDLGQSGFANSFSTTTKTDSSPLSFVDNVEIVEMKFISGTRNVYYKIYNKDKNTTFCGLIDIKENKVLYNIEADDVTFIPDSSGQMLAITSDSLYKVCVVKVNNECSDTSTCAKIMLDPDGNKCQDHCDDDKIFIMPEGICIDKSLCDLNIYVFNDDETECGLCK